MFRIVKQGTTEKLIIAITTSRFSSGAKYTASSITATFYKVNAGGSALEIDTSIGTSGVVTLSADTGSKTGFHSALLDVSGLTAKVYIVLYEATVDSVAAISSEFLDIDAERKKIADTAFSTHSAADVAALILTDPDTDKIDGSKISGVTGILASQAEVLAIQNNTRVRVIVPAIMERPDTGSTAFKLWLYLYDEIGNMEAPDALPTITAENQGGTDRSGNLGTVTLEGTGSYSVTYTLASDALMEQLQFEWSTVEGGNTRKHGAATQVVDTTDLGTGTGARQVTIQLYLTGTTTPMADVSIQVYNSTQTLLLGSGTSGLLGNLNFALDDGVYKVRLNKVGCNFTVPETITVVGDSTKTLYGSEVGVGVPTSASSCRVYYYIANQDDGTFPTSIVATAKIIALPYDYNGKLHKGNKVHGTYSSSTGLLYWDIAKLATVEFSIKEFTSDSGYRKVVTDASSASLTAMEDAIY